MMGADVRRQAVHETHARKRNGAAAAFFLLGGAATCAFGSALMRGAISSFLLFSSPQLVAARFGGLAVKRWRRDAGGDARQAGRAAAELATRRGSHSPAQELSPAPVTARSCFNVTWLRWPLREPNGEGAGPPRPTARLLRALWRDH